jgi:hypothetical protein
VSSPQARHALARPLGALIGPNSENDADRAAPVSITTSALAGCAEDASLLAKHGRKRRSEGEPMLAKRRTAFTRSRGNSNISVAISSAGLLEQNTPIEVRRILATHDVRTASQMGWAGLSNSAQTSARDCRETTVQAARDSRCRPDSGSAPHCSRSRRQGPRRRSHESHAPRLDERELAPRLNGAPSLSRGCDP